MLCHPVIPANAGSQRGWETGAEHCRPVIPSEARNLSPSLQRKGTRRAKRDAGDALLPVVEMPSSTPCIPRSHHYARSRPLTLREGGVRNPLFVYVRG